jgi:AcrR family transcriptional regulator
MTTSLNETDSDRKQTIVSLAAGIFVRFGYKKTSMDEVAQTVRLSRQGLYLHFPNKETLFREVVAYLGLTVVSALDRALERPELDLEERLHAGFLAMYSGAFGAHDSEHLQELFASAVEICPDELAALDETIVASLARVLEAVANGLWSPQVLADTLYSASYGWKHRGISPEDYSLKMKNAVRLVRVAKS